MVPGAPFIPGQKIVAGIKSRHFLFEWFPEFLNPLILRIIEDELFEVESYDNATEFLGKSFAYKLFINYIRKNRYRDNKPPVEIFRE